MGFIIEKIRDILFYMFKKAPTEYKNNRRIDNRLDGSDMVVSINGEKFKVIDWSYGGVLIEANNINSTKFDDLNLTLCLNHDKNVIILSHTGKILRQDNKGTVVKLNPLGGAIHRQFNYMIDAVLAENFLRSQTA